MDADPAPLFDEARARDLLARACAGLGLPEPAGARLIALGENAVFDLGDPAVVAKVGRHPELAERAGRELAVARWLDGAGIPVPRPADGLVEQPGGRPPTADGHPVTFWHRLAPQVRPATPADLGPLLRALHLLPGAPALDPPLPPRRLLAPVPRWLHSATGLLDPADTGFLLRLCEQREAELAELVPVLPTGLIHGDALPRNVHLGPHGPVLVDLETVADDLREHDLVVVALGYLRYGMAEADYLAFARGYGWDVRDWAGFRVLCGAREIASAAWVAQHAANGGAAPAEFRRRVASLRDGDRSVRWHSF
ncbi:phosphotransferase enzyme family protein [Kitasatospora viridis]|uniref:Aminoglycoside phosphotransferase (APT) family kinase protein n=1 Tax=Kitasatospora viridis TaxID=281105 RepID=A0A561UMH7_9ACTN|nr:aminoglycoside phosphotransferase family protein [Kitasatospora viridis]TWG00575.1 aminoglycoside phosphotransferase (APT) family kinase protein [Kitasatospora viridis]